MPRPTKLAIAIAVCLIATSAISQEVSKIGTSSRSSLILQVVGKQPSSRQLEQKKKPTSTNRSSAPVATKSSRTSSTNRRPTGGILSRMFGGGQSQSSSDRSASSSNSQRSSQQRSSTPQRSSLLAGRVGSSNNKPLSSPFIRNRSASPAPSQQFNTASNRSAHGTSPSYTKAAPANYNGAKSTGTPKPYRAGSPQPLLDPEDREVYLAEQQAIRAESSARMPRADNYDSNGEVTQESSAALNPPLSVAVAPRPAAPSRSSTSSSRRAERRTRESLDELSQLAQRVKQKSVKIEEPEVTPPVEQTPTTVYAPEPQHTAQESPQVSRRRVAPSAPKKVEPQVAVAEQPAPALQPVQPAPRQAPEPKHVPETIASSTTPKPPKTSPGQVIALPAESGFRPRTTPSPSATASQKSPSYSVPQSPAPRSYQVPAATVAARQTPPAQSIPNKAPASSVAAPAAAQQPIASAPAVPRKPAAPKSINNSIPLQPRNHAGRILASEIPAIRVQAHGPEEIRVNQVTDYAIIVENRGSSSAPGVMIVASLPAWTNVRSHEASSGSVSPEPDPNQKKLIWRIEQLPAGATQKLVLKIAAQKAETIDVGLQWTVLPVTKIAKVRVQQPRVKLMIDGPEEIVFGSTQTYKVRVLNPGNGTAENVMFTLSPDSPNPQAQRLGQIPPGKEAEVEIELTARDRNGLQIHGVASGDESLKDETVKNIRVLSADLVATLNGPPLKYHNTTAKYDLTVKNEGKAASSDVVGVVRLPQGVIYRGGLENSEVVGEYLRWKIGKLPPGASVQYSFQCDMTSTGKHLLAFECRGSAAGRATVSLSTAVEAIADLVLSINDPTAPAPVGEDVEYEIVIRNRGTRAAEQVAVVAQFSNGIEPTELIGAKGEIVPGQALFEPLQAIAAGQEVKLRVRAKATKAAHHRFRAEVSSGETVLVAEEATRYMEINTQRVSSNSKGTASR